MALAKRREHRCMDGSFKFIFIPIIVDQISISIDSIRF